MLPINGIIYEDFNNCLKSVFFQIIDNTSYCPVNYYVNSNNLTNYLKILSRKEIP